jgi:1-acyl-sn-glycerol-3-phosphate acyltransferase
MTDQSAKPVSQFQQAQQAQLPKLTRGRIWFRRFINAIVRFLVWVSTRPSVSGLENFPTQGPALVVCNHLGDLDDLLKVTFLPRQIEAVAKVEFANVPIFGRLMDSYGVIWIRRGQPDRQALRVVIQGLADNRLVMINPEGRESLTGALEEATNGAAFLALKANAPIVPLAITGTENKNLYSNLRQLRRTPVTFRIGQPFYLSQQGDHKRAVEEGTQKIMKTIAELLPPEYRGVYETK